MHDEYGNKVLLLLLVVVVFICQPLQITNKTFKTKFIYTTMNFDLTENASTVP